MTDEEIGLFWTEIGNSPNSQRIGLELKFALLRGARVTEVAGAEICEFVRLDDAGSATWTIPSVRSKNGKAHVVPLSAYASIIMSDLINLAKTRQNCKGRYLLESPTGRDQPVAGHALSVAMSRFGAKMLKSNKDNVPGVKSWRAEQPTAHDLRRTMATRLSAAGVPTEDVSACLNHSRKGVTATHYDHYDRAREKRRAFARWGGVVKEIIDGQGTLSALPLEEAAG